MYTPIQRAPVDEEAKSAVTRTFSALRLLEEFSEPGGRKHGSINVERETSSLERSKDL